LVPGSRPLEPALSSHQPRILTSPLSPSVTMLRAIPDGRGQRGPHFI
jgi:hypothetical protein